MDLPHRANFQVNKDYEIGSINSNRNCKVALRGTAEWYANRLTSINTVDDFLAQFEARFRTDSFAASRNLLFLQQNDKESVPELAKRVCQLWEETNEAESVLVLVFMNALDKGAHSFMVAVEVRIRPPS